MNNYTKRNHSGNARNDRRSNFSRGAQRPATKGRAASKLDPMLLIKKATANVEEDFRSEREIKDLPIHPDLIKLLEAKGYKRPSEIQDKTLEALLEEKNLLGIAQTGTGKTAAFLIPIIEQLIASRRKSYALIVVPTRELASQVEEEFRSMTKGLELYSACFIGGTNIATDIKTLRRGSHVIIGTPGRLLDLQQRKALDLRKFNTLVLDEFDRMLDMGFQKDVDRIISSMHNRKQTMLFSATLNNSQQGLIQQILKEFVTVKITAGNSSADSIDQDIIKLKQGEDKYQVLLEMLSNKEFSKVILFDETKHRVNRLCQKLNQSGIKSDQIQGNKTQAFRQKALKAFKEGRINVLVATDVAARGIDVSDVTHVINYQLPMTYDSYIHRIGRTGRAGQIGKAFTFIG